MEKLIWISAAGGNGYFRCDYFNSSGILLNWMTEKNSTHVLTVNRDFCLTSSDAIESINTGFCGILNIKEVSKIKYKQELYLAVVLSVGHDSVRKLSWHSVYEQVGRRKLGQDIFRHGRFTIIAKQRSYSLYKAKQEDALYAISIFSYSVQADDLLQEKRKPKGDCLLTVGDDELIKIHFHTNESWKVLECCSSLGDIYDVVIEHRERQSKGLQG